MHSRERQHAELVDVIGEKALTLLAENFGGTRLYVPARILSDHEIAVAIGLDAATKLALRFAPDVIRVPLFRERRAVRYRSEGLTNAKIAVRLGMTEVGINRLFKRMKNAGQDLPATSSRTLDR